MEPKRSQKISAGPVMALVGAIVFVAGLLLCACMAFIALKFDQGHDGGFIETFVAILVGIPLLIVGVAVFLIGLLTGLVMQFTQRWDRNFRVRNQRKPGGRVRHLTFGEGIVLSSKIVEDIEFVEVQFQEKFGKKRVPTGTPILEKL